MVTVRAHWLTPPQVATLSSAERPVPAQVPAEREPYYSDDGDEAHGDDDFELPKGSVPVPVAGRGFVAGRSVKVRRVTTFKDGSHTTVVTYFTSRMSRRCFDTIDRYTTQSGGGGVRVQRMCL